jgi:hypothetical protein
MTSASSYPLPTGLHIHPRQSSTLSVTFATSRRYCGSSRWGAGRLVRPSLLQVARTACTEEAGCREQREVTDSATLAWHRTQGRPVAKVEVPCHPAVVGQLVLAAVPAQAVPRGCSFGTVAVQRTLRAGEHWVGCLRGVRLVARQENRRSWSMSVQTVGCEAGWGSRRPTWRAPGHRRCSEDDLEVGCNPESRVSLPGQGVESKAGRLAEEVMY